MIDRGALAESLHTALRKLGDSTPTTLAWHLIYLADSSWGAYLDRLCVELKSDSPIELKHITLRLFEDPGPPEVRGEHHLWMALRCAFRMFNDHDWRAFAGYLEYVSGIQKSGVKTSGEVGEPEVEA